MMFTHSDSAAQEQTENESENKTTQTQCIMGKTRK